MRQAASELLARYQPREFRPAAQAITIDFPLPGVVILARDNPDGRPTLVTSLFARHDAGSVGASLLRVQAAAGKTGHFIFIVPVEKFYEASRIQLEFQAVCEAEEPLPSEEG
jgi:hypothetical protein